jgi:hypothetical protein
MSRVKDIREQCDKCRHFTGIGTSGEPHKRIQNRNIDDIDNKQAGRGWCAAGVFYNDVMKSGKRMISLPCFRPERDNMPDDGVWPTCPKLEFKSAEELDAEAAEIEQHAKQFMERVTVVRPAILKHAKLKDQDMHEDEEIPAGARRAMDGVTVIAKDVKSKAGSFACPICKTGTLRYTVSGYNGHVHAMCSTADCVSWME